MPSSADPGDRAPVVVVVGGGISGLAAAWEIRRSRPDARVVVLERSAEVGGKLARAEVGAHLVDVGAEALLARRPEAIELLAELGLEGEIVHPVTTTAGIWSRGAISPLPPGSLMGVPSSSASAVPLLTDSEAEAIDAEPDRPADPLSDDIDVASYVRSRVGAPVLDRIVEPLLGGVYAGHADRLSLQATVPAMWDAARAGTSLVSAARTASARTSSGAPSGATDDPPAPVFAGLRSGVGRLPVELAAALVRAGADIRTGTTVRDIRRTPSGWSLVIGSRADERLLEADAIVIAVPAHPAARLLSGIAPEASRRLAAIETASMALVTAVLPGGAAAASGRGSGLLVPPVEAKLIKAATYSSAKWGWLAEQAGGDLVVRLSIGRAGEESDLQRPDEELIAGALTELALAWGVELPRPLDARVTRWGGALPQYAVGHVDAIASARADVARIGGIAVCGGYLDGLGVPACIASARRAAAQALADLPGPAAPSGPTMEP